MNKLPNIERPYENSGEWRQVTVEDLIAMLEKVPKDYEVKYDSALGQIMKSDFTIYHDSKEISLNG
jgi:hypothetical protein